MRTRGVLVIGVLVLGACGDGLAAPVPPESVTATTTATSGGTAAGLVAEPAATAETAERTGALGPHNAPTTGASTTITVAAEPDRNSETDVASTADPTAAPEPGAMPDIDVPDTSDLDGVLADIDALLAELETSFEEQEGSITP
jgi:hypothetical protein